MSRANTVKSVVKKTACNYRTNVLEAKAEQVSILQSKCTFEHRSRKVAKWKNCTISL
jgi:hypothetical protein